MLVDEWNEKNSHLGKEGALDSVGNLCHSKDCV